MARTIQAGYDETLRVERDGEEVLLYIDAPIKHHVDIYVSGYFVSLTTDQTKQLIKELLNNV